MLSLSNQAETFGRTALEALSVGTPVIGWNRGGVAEILSRLYPQGLIEVDDLEALLNCVKHHIDHRQQVEPVTQFSLDEMCNQTIQLLSLIHISEPTRPSHISRMPSSA